MPNQPHVIADPHFTINEAADYIRCSKLFIWRRRKEGKLVGLRAGRKVLFKKSELDAYLEKKV